ncbi:MAG TPA: hypothetical protein VJP80_03570 [Candidatus Saccharimonadales bacterium]|nr:hypothetical protein [Candidatus Saccharimonadales bacterium]
MEKLVKQLRRDYPSLTFVEGEVLCWSPAEGHIFYPSDDSPAALSGLFHELAHAALQHRGYTTDLDLVRKEMLAWQAASRIADSYDVQIDSEHAQDCLDTYRDWVFKRSRCPHCNSSGLQSANLRYACLNCQHTWGVSASRFCRPYRLSKNRAAA